MSALVFIIVIIVFMCMIGTAKPDNKATRALFLTE